MLFSKPALPKSLEHWFLDPNLVEGLRAALEDPVLQTAIASLLSAAAPSLGNALDADKNSLRLSWLAGYNDAFRDLHKLTVQPRRAQDVESWAHIH